MPKLRIDWGDATEFKVLTDNIQLGSDLKNHICLQGHRVSKKHCEIRKEGKLYKLIDLSRYGTHVNGTPVRECRLRNGDSIIIGDTILTFLEEGKSDAPARERRKPSASVKYLDREPVTELLKINTPIQLGKGVHRDFTAISLEKFRILLGAQGLAMFLCEYNGYRLVRHAGLEAILDEAQLLVFDPLLSKIREIKSLQEINDLAIYGIDVGGSACQNIGKILAVPLMEIKTEIVASFAIEQRPQGILLALYGPKKKKITAEEQTFAEALAHQIATKIRNSDLFQQASSDSLTFLYNRGFFEQAFAKEIKIAAKTDSFVSVALIDLDYFRYFNERYGVSTGDEVLRQVAQVISCHLSPEDVAARYGGEKFIVILPAQSTIRAYNWAETTRRAIEEHFSQKYNITVSVGIATFPDNAPAAEELLKRADQALYRAKFEGRNKSVYYDESIDAGGPRTDMLAGVISGNSAKDYANIQRLVETVNIMASYGDYRQLVEKLVDKVLEISHAERAIIFLGDNSQDLKIHYSRDIFHQRCDNIDRYSTSIPQKVFTSGQSLCIIDEVGTSEDTSLSMAQFELRTVMCAPLCNKEQKTFGVLYVDSRVQQKKYQASDLLFFETITKQIALAIENANLRQIAQEKQRLQHELQLASSIQQRFLPQRIPVLQNFVIYGQMWPAYEVGGDYYDILHIENKKLYICIGDVSGKGLGAGLIMAMVRTALHSLIGQNSNLPCSQLLFQINNMIYENTNTEMFMSMLLMEVHLEKNTIAYSGAGHEHILIYRSKKRCCEKIVTGGVILGIKRNLQYPLRGIKLDKGDKLILYTDGATEALNFTQQEFGLDNVISLVERYNALSCKELCNTIYREIKEFIGSENQYDDITLLALECSSE